MSFLETLGRARAFLEQHQRISLRALRREFSLDNETLAELTDELVHVQRVARIDGEVLVWTAAVAPEAAIAGATTRTATSSLHERAPLSYTPKHLADKILQSRSALEGERKQVTVLFADVKGSMELASQVDAEEWHKILERFFEILSEGVHRFEGTVNQYTGDGIMALFGAPIAHEDHARRACYAALQLQEGLRGYANELRLRRGLNFSARIGINSGEVIVGAIGDDLRMDYTAQGQTVGLAARMEQIAEPGKVYLTANTAALVDGYFALTDLGAMEIKGVQGAMHVHELQGTGVMRTRLDVSRSRGFSRFVGRGDEMQMLEAALARAREGNAQIVGIVGDAGLGKSRLCFEFLERCRARGLMTNETTGVSHGKAIPFLPMLRLFRAFFGITEHDSDATARERIAGRLLLLDERLRDSLPLLFDFMGVPDPENPAPRVDVEVRQRLLFDIVRRVTQARGQKETSVTLLEDLHWFDAGSAAFLEPLIDAAIGTRSMVILNFRPEYQAPWRGRSFYQQIPLAPLGPDAIRELLGALLGNDPSTKGLAEVIHSRTAGNPFFTEEIVQNLIETKKLQGAKGAYKLVTPVDKLEVPATVHALLAARIDRLTEREKDVLQTAAVIGREFDEPTLAAVVEQEAPQLREALQKLKDTEFVYEQSLYPVAEYAFKHPLTQEVALASQLSEKRRKLHAAVARVIEAAHGGDATKLDEQAALLAHHWGEAGEVFAAATWHARAAALIEKDDLDEAGRHWQKVRELVRTVRDEPGAAALGLDACFHGLAMGMRVDLADDVAGEMFREGLTWAALTGDALSAARMHQAFSVYEVRRNRIDSAVAHAAEWARVAGVSADAERRACSLWPSLDPLVLRGDLAAARKNAAAQHDWTRGHFEWGQRDWGGISAHASALVQLGYCEIYAGSLPAAREYLERGIEVARGVGDREMEAYCCETFGEVGFVGRDADVGRAAVHRLVELSADLQLYYRVTGLFRFGVQALLEGEADRAVAALEDARAQSRPATLYREQQFGYTLAHALLAAGKPDEARLIAEDTYTHSQKIGARIDAIHAVLALTPILRIDADEATLARIDELLTTADKLIAATGARNLAPFVLLERAAVCQLRGETQQRLTHLRGAHAGFVLMGAAKPAAEIAPELGL